MKKLYAAFIFFAALIVAAAVWFSPFGGSGGQVYENNIPVHEITGICYGQDEAVRIDIDGGEEELAAAFRKISASAVKTVSIDGLTVVYAFSPRVCAKLYTDDGAAYNVMAAWGNGHIAIGAPVLQGSY